MSGVVEAARLWLGTPYRHQASCLGAGCDCLGLLRGVWREVVGAEPAPMPPYRASIRDPDSAGLLQAAAERWLVGVDGPLGAGQVLLFRLHRGHEPSHCGILVSQDRFIHAQERLGVVEANLTAGWRERVWGRFGFPAV